MRTDDQRAETWEERMARLDRDFAEREADPEYQAEQARLEEINRRDLEATLKRQKAEEFERSGAPAKDRELISSGLLTETQAIRSVKTADWRLLALSGGPGSGKTTAATAWLYDTIDKHPRFAKAKSSSDLMLMPYRYPGHIMALFVTAARLSRWPKYDDAQMLKLLSAESLVIDDLGAEFVDEKGSYLSLLDEVINERYANRRPTLLTTNLNIEGFKGRYGERIADRIREAGKFVGVGSKSMRGKQ